MKKTLTTATVAAFLAATPAPAEPSIQDTVQWLANMLNSHVEIERRSHRDFYTETEQFFQFSDDSIHIVELKYFYRKNGELKFSKEISKRLNFQDLLYPVEFLKDSYSHIHLACHSNKGCNRFVEDGGKTEFYSGTWIRPIDTKENATRIKSAFDHLIRLSGGRKRVKEGLF